MQRIVRDQAMEYEFDHRHAPKLRVSQGESFVVETEDALSGNIRSEDRLPTPVHVPTLLISPPELNMYRPLDAAISGFPAPIYFPTIEFTATFNPIAGMKLKFKYPRAIQPAVMSSSPKWPTKTVIKIAQQMISLPH